MLRFDCGNKSKNGTLVLWQQLERCNTCFTTYLTLDHNYSDWTMEKKDWLWALFYSKFKFFQSAPALAFAACKMLNADIKRPEKNASKCKNCCAISGPNAASLLTEPPAVPPGYMTFRDIGEQSEGICFRDVTSPINELDGQSNSSRGEKHTITRVLWHLNK